MAKRAIQSSGVKTKKAAKAKAVKPVAQTKTGATPKAPKKVKPIVASPFVTADSIRALGTSATVVLSVPTPEQPYLVERLLTEDEVAAEYLARQEELDAQFEKASAVLKRWAPKLRKTAEFKNHHITGMCLRFRSKFSHTVSPLRVVIAVNVATKFSPRDLDFLHIPMLPRTVDGIPVKVLEGCFCLLPGEAVELRGLFTKPKNPILFTAELVGGIPIAPLNHPEAFGTLGVVLADSAGDWLGITCQHVANGIGSIVEQLGPDNAAGSTSRRIGTVVRAVKAVHKHSVDQDRETVDCASVTLDQTAGVVLPQGSNGWIRGINQTPPIPLFYSMTRMEAVHKSYTVWKFGSATGEAVQGTILDTNSLQFDIGNVRFENNFSIEFDRFATPAMFSPSEFLIPGDSGSIVALEVQVNGNRAFVAVGVLFARLSTNPNIGFACNMRHVIDALKIDIPTDRLITSWTH